jgi:hypothetical protein
MTDNIDNWCQQWGGYWSQHPQYTVNDWIEAVDNCDTRQGYWEWVQSQIANEEEA